MTRLNELRLISRVAQMYHLEGRRQAEIAQHLRLSQATVSRMLKRAEAEDIVRTSVTPPAGTYSELEGALREKYDLPEAIVVECTEDRDGAIMARIGEAAAHLLEVTLAPGEIIGVSSWSQTISKMVENIHPLKSAQAKYVVQTLGGMGDPSVQTHATQLTTRLARLTGAEPKLLPVQGVTTSREAKLLMQADPFVRETMDLFGSITLAIVGIGAVEPSELLARSGNIFSSRELSDLAEAGAVGDISLRFFDRNGKPVKTPLDDRVIGLPLEDLERVDRVIALAGGTKKTDAIAGALRVGVIDMLVTDKFTAQRLID
ncbi:MULTISPECIES: sugar-binding transcriptional regulator [Rhizobium]|jgi:DNA-binding transcriptional regulator LsrR (DeoR family)|uniref:DNA-binding transcriptional regulator n=1 Tax=Rhizobium anhuiense TaxID=1184720 RepID=A0A432NK92_9HYPH|nr:MULTISPECIES: sugar-binding transcriptional regulator [Rhizobium]KZS52266.1 DNA-binding transcriptional regulator [Rhizobium anhuiense bv. trifolii]MBB3301094.1 DNA-binding transcriptional regulator LsrR (DeoR family) [Rhizobium sp. BK112]MBB3368717.1 DNA-binding transcriptional regulator LsrR (DeoR family) [Rhizobium sp. BK077]MBB3741673.1 DNA-binding transcriptional regulator LsrR (DeoR family) [Rhizobium sp. BK591]MBB4180984.1 DNA-binding transcriptional regulator LsrR (DeoR family) [Rhi